MTNHLTPDEFTARLNNSPWLLPQNRPRPKPEPEDPSTHSGFRRMLQGIIGPDELLWPSEEDHPVEVVRIADSVVFGWVPETFVPDQRQKRIKMFDPPGFELEEVANAPDGDQRFMQLALAFDGRKGGCVFYRLTDEANVYDLYLLVWFRKGRRWVGLKTRVVET